MNAANIRFKKLLRVSFIFVKGIIIAMTDHIKAAPINKYGVMF